MLLLTCSLYTFSEQTHFCCKTLCTIIHDSPPCMECLWISHLCLCWQKSCQAGSWTWPRWPSQRSVKSRSFRRSWRPSTSCWGPTVGPSSGMWTVSITSTSVTSMLKLTLQQLSSALEINWMKLPVYNMGQSILDKWIALFSMTFGYFYLPLDYPSHLNANFFPLTLHLHIGRTS